MAGKRRFHNPVPVSDLVTKIVDPVLARRAGISTDLVQSWDGIVGDRLGAVSRPEKISWPRRADDTEPFEPATLTIACEGGAALHIQHETGSIIAKVNGFLGFAAIGRVKIVQKPVTGLAKEPGLAPRPISDERRKKIAATVAPVDDEALREALARLGASVAGARK